MRDRRTQGDTVRASCYWLVGCMWSVKLVCSTTPRTPTVSPLATTRLTASLDVLHSFENMILPPGRTDSPV